MRELTHMELCLDTQFQKFGENPHKLVGSVECLHGGNVNADVNSSKNVALEETAIIGMQVEVPDFTN